MKTTIFCFSGSGNSYWVATQLRQALGDCEILMIPTLMETERIELGERVGFIYPVYKFFPPNLVTHFVEEILSTQDFSGVTYLFQVATRYLFSAWATQAMESVLNGVGLSVSYTNHVVMPDTYVPFFKTPSQERIDTLYTKATQRLGRIARQISEQEISVAANAPFGRLATKYLMRPIHRSLMDDAEHFRVNERCDGCELCYRICPSQNIEMVGGRPQYDRVCSGCLACYHRCPQQAIEFTKRIRGSHYPNPRSGYRLEYRI
jgi:Pyruvate/2-oxoacid:ferredoxin oxidoreductase delta subunit